MFLSAIFALAVMLGCAASDQDANETSLVQSKHYNAANPNGKRGTYLTADDFARASELSESDLVAYGDKNKMYGTHFEGDIVLDQQNRAANGQETSIKEHSEVMNNALRNQNARWSEATIPYQIDPIFNKTERAIIAAAIIDYHNLTCIKFVPRSAERDYVYIHKGFDCSSFVGRHGEHGEQSLSLGNGCVRKDIVLHELMHAIGFKHEQSRTDRDLYVKIVWENILVRYTNQFQKYSLEEIDHLGEPYDYNSIMHYESTAFTKNGEPTIVPINPPNATIGNATELSQIDINKINKLYNCTPPTTTSTSRKPITTTPEGCADKHRSCKSFAILGYCQFLGVGKLCPSACGKCGNGISACVNDGGDESCEILAAKNMCTDALMGNIARVECAKSCKVCT